MVCHIGGQLGTKVVISALRMLALYMCFNGTGIWGGETLYLFGYTKGLSKSLQGCTLDVVEAHKHVSLVRDELQSVRRNAKQKFLLLYDKMKKMSNHGGVEMSMPRRCGRQTLRSNIKAKKNNYVLQARNICTIP